MRKITPKEFEEMTLSIRTELLGAFNDPNKVTEQTVYTYMAMKSQELWFERIHNLIQNEHSRTKQHVREGVGQYQLNVLSKLDELEKLITNKEEE